MPKLIQGVPINGFWPEPGTETPDYNNTQMTDIRVDSRGNLSTRGAVTTDEGSIREDFSGANIYNTLSGTVTFTNGSVYVKGVGTTFANGSMQYGDYIKLSSDADTAYTKILSIKSDTEIILASAYSDVGGSGTAYTTKMRPITGSGGSISLASSRCTITSGTTTGAKTEITREIDYGPLIITATATVTARNANQTGYIGLVDDAVNPNISAWFLIDGVTATSIKTVTQSSSSANDTETNIVTIPTTASDRRYRIELGQEYCAFYIDDVLYATHKTHLPSPYAYMDGVVGWVNGTTPTTASIQLDSFYCGNIDALNIMTGFGTLPLSMNNTQVGNNPIITGGVGGAQGVAGAIAHDGVGTSSYPVKTGARAITANYTAVSSGDVADAVCTVVGAQIFKSYSIPEADWQYATPIASPITNTTAVALKTAGAAGIRNYVTGLQIINTSATVSSIVTVQDGSTVIWTGFVPATTSALQIVPVIIQFATPLRGTAATAMNFVVNTTSANVFVSAQGYQAP